MTHSLHRIGTRDSLSRDIIFLCLPAKNYNDIDSGPKLAEFMRLAVENGSVKIGNSTTGNEYTLGSEENVIKSTTKMATVHAVFNDQSKAISFLSVLKNVDLGLSIVISGLLDAVDDCCRQSGLQRHTVEHSLGFFGRTDRLPGKQIMELNTMCGHGMVTVNLINAVIEKIKKGRITPEEGAEQLFKPCTCGIFNPDRAAEILKLVIEKDL